MLKVINNNLVNYCRVETLEKKKLWRSITEITIKAPTIRKVIPGIASALPSMVATELHRKILVMIFKT